MLFPKGQPTYENLNTSFTQLDAMLSELKNSQFTGYVQLTAWEYDGILLFDTGNLVNATEQQQDQRRHGPDAAEGIARKSRAKDGALSVYRMPPETIQLLANLFNSEALYKDLSSDLIGLDKLIAKLQSEKHTGFIEINLPQSKHAASIYLRDGQIVASVYLAHGATASQDKAPDEIVLATLDDPALFTVYRADLAHAYGDAVNFADSFARQDMLALWQRVLQSIETTLNDKTGAFNTAFKRACNTNAAAYPFLDPFAGELEYKAGALKFAGQASVAQFNAGMSKTLAQALRDLATQPAHKQWLNKLKPMAAELKTAYGSRLTQVGLTDALPELFEA